MSSTPAEIKTLPVATTASVNTSSPSAASEKKSKAPKKESKKEIKETKVPEASAAEHKGKSSSKGKTLTNEGEPEPEPESEGKDDEDEKKSEWCAVMIFSKLSLLELRKELGEFIDSEGDRGDIAFLNVERRHKKVPGTPGHDFETLFNICVMRRSAYDTLVENKFDDKDKRGSTNISLIRATPGNKPSERNTSDWFVFVPSSEYFDGEDLMTSEETRRQIQKKIAFLEGHDLLPAKCATIDIPYKDRGANDGKGLIRGTAYINFNKKLVDDDQLAIARIVISATNWTEPRSSPPKSVKRFDVRWNAKKDSRPSGKKGFSPSVKGVGRKDRSFIHEDEDDEEDETPTPKSKPTSKSEKPKKGEWVVAGKGKRGKATTQPARKGSSKPEPKKEAEESEEE